MASVPHNIMMRVKLVLCMKPAQHNKRDTASLNEQ